MWQQDDAKQSIGTRYLLQEIAAHLDAPDIDDTEAVAQQFDVSPFRLWVLFQSVDRDGDGHVTKEELVECLASTELLRESVLGAGPLHQLWSLLTGDEPEGAREIEMEEEEEEKIISFQQFCRLIRYLWLQQLLNEDLDWKGTDGKKDYTFDCVDYAGTFHELTAVPGRINTESRRFFTVPRHPRAKMRWIDLPSSSPKAVRVAVLRLAVKYRFHPTSVEDVLELEQQQPKVNWFENSLLDLGDFRVESIVWLKHGGAPGDGNTKDIPKMESNEEGTLCSKSRISDTTSLMRNHSFGSAYGSAYGNASIGEEDIVKGHGKHYFIVIPMFELTERSAKSLERFGGSSEEERDSFHGNSALELEPPVIEIQRATLGMFVASDPEPNLLVTVSSKWRPTRVKPFDEDDEMAMSSGMQRRRKSEEKTRAKLKSNKAALERVKHLLEKRHAIQRHGNADWLMHAIIDAVVDNLSPIAKIYEAELEYMSARLMELGHRLSKREVKDMIVMKRDLEWLQHELRPLHRVLRHLIDDKNIGVSVTHYLEDVEDHLDRMQEELLSYAGECERLKDEFNSYQDRRLNDVLYFLTLVTALVVPAQFLTGYFGMNFENDDKSLGAPLLNLGYIGLVWFWVITVVSTGVVAFIMYRYKVLEKPAIV